ncbi:MAG: SGNH/GDSL hydrolase family protein [Muribaculaceae bacterium]|nr:SGNH/GDSL hydrolase family protein [Muribaculaceae bacterium]
MGSKLIDISRRAIATVIISAIALSAFPQVPDWHPWKGRNIAYFGDSITDPRNKAASKKYWSWLQEWLGTTPWVYAVSGRTWNDIPRQTNKLIKEHGDEVDAIIILIGTNDFANAVPLGCWYDETEATVTAGLKRQKRDITLRRRTLSTDQSTYRGRINIALSKLKQVYPDKQIVLLTPLHRGGFYLSDTNWQPTEEWPNEAGEYIDAYVEATKEAANVWAVPVIDLNSTSGLFPMADTQARYFADEEIDRLHPNNDGHRRMAATLLYQLGALPAAF